MALIDRERERVVGAAQTVNGVMGAVDPGKVASVGWPVQLSSGNWGELKRATGRESIVEQSMCTKSRGLTLAVRALSVANLLSCTTLPDNSGLPSVHCFIESNF